MFDFLRDEDLLKLTERVIAFGVLVGEFLGFVTGFGAVFLGDGDLAADLIFDGVGLGDSDFKGVLERPRAIGLVASFLEEAAFAPGLIEREGVVCLRTGERLGISE